ncbi:hypothetical protein M758_UG143900 [Ceratodon purpureus]|nr:hypothetical protein M758_UG143900 [Ceratodon purpureus]
MFYQWTHCLHSINFTLLMIKRCLFLQHTCEEDRILHAFMSGFMAALRPSLFITFF